MSTTIRVDRMAFGGDGVSKLPDGKTVFVRGAVPGDTLDITVTREHASHCNAEIDKIVEPSPSRIAPICSNAGRCGGCPWQTMDYNEQLRWKREFVVDSLKRIGKVGDAIGRVSSCVPSKENLGYRNKIELVPVTGSGRKLQLGYHTRGSNDVVPIERCSLLPKSASKTIRSITGALRFLKASDYGLKRVGIRVSSRTGKVQLALWTSPDYFPRKAAADVLSSAVEYTSLTRVLVRDGEKSRRPVGVELLDGEETWSERLLDATMTVSAPSFFQVNTQGAEELINRAMDGLTIMPDDICCDLYCGAGTFTIPIAKRSDNVIAIEAASSSIRDLRRNLDLNDVDAEVIGGDAARESEGIGSADKLLVDPPSSGMERAMLDRIREMSPSRMVMVSCNPSTLGRDLAGLSSIGYSIESVTPVDMFPQTYHIETVTILAR